MKKILLFIVTIVVVLSIFFINKDYDNVVFVTNVADVLKTMNDLSPSNENIGSSYANLPSSTVSNNFLSRETFEYDIDGNKVTVDEFVLYANESLNNPNFGFALLLSQAINYKIAYPTEDVSIFASSFHFSISASACLDPESDYYGYMRGLYDNDYDEYGFVRIAYLFVLAAKYEINVHIIGQTNSATVLQDDGYKYDLDYCDYFNRYVNSEKTFSNKPLSDYLEFKKAYWTSYGDKAATDMLHIKGLAVSNYLDSNGNTHSGSIFLSSMNLDSIGIAGVNSGNNNMQTGVIISDHEELYQTLSNVICLCMEFSKQEDIYELRNVLKVRAINQLNLINNGHEELICSNERVVYKSFKDNVFELYFTPFSNEGVWDTKYNPICKCLSKLPVSDDYIEFIYVNAKYMEDQCFTRMIEDVVLNAFKKSNNENNALYSQAWNFGSKYTNELTFKSRLLFLWGVYHADKYDSYVKQNHAKDMLLSYSEDNKREYVSILNSCNCHEGAFFYQLNQCLIIKENEDTGNDFYKSFSSYIATPELWD